VGSDKALAFSRWGLLFLLSWAGFLGGQQIPPSCKSCAVWNTPQAPFLIYGNTYYVGPRGLSSILVTSGLITSGAGHVLIDGALPESASQIAANIRSLGFRIEDVKLIVNSHVHFDHAGGIAELQRLSGARVAASPWSAAVMKTGGVAGQPREGSASTPNRRRSGRNNRRFRCPPVGPGCWRATIEEEAHMPAVAAIIHRDPEILGGTPVFTGTRVPFRNLIDYIERNHSIEEFLDSFPTVSREQVVAVLEAAHEAVSALADSSR